MNELATRNGGGEILSMTASQGQPPPSVELYQFDQMVQLAEAVAKSGFIKGARTPESALALMLVCRAQGRHIGEAITRFHIIEGVPTVKAEIMLAEFQANGGMCEWGETNRDEASATFSHPRLHPKPLPIRVTLKELVEDGVAVTWDDRAKGMVLKANYKRSAASMLRARVITQGVRAVDPGSLHGFHSSEEVTDFAEIAEEIAPRLPPPATPAIEAARMEAFGPDLPGQPTGPDDRPYHKVVADAVEASNARLANAIGLLVATADRTGPLRPLAAGELHGHLLLKAIQLGYDGEAPTNKNTERIHRLTKVYKEHRGWVRGEILAYLEVVETEAKASLDAIREQAAEAEATEGAAQHDDPSVEAIPASERTGKGKTSQGTLPREAGSDEDK